MKISPKSKSSILSIISNLFLIVFKLVIGFATNSTSVISDGVHSFIDLISSLATFATLQLADKPPDKQHNYGHQKIQDIGALMQFILIFGTGVLIIVIAINNIFNPVLIIKHITIAFTTMFLSAIVNLTVSMYLKEMAKQYNSIALLAEGKHRMSDVFSSLGISIALFLVWLTHLALLDQIISIGIGILICYESLDILKQSLNSLLDHSLPDSELKQITNILDKYKNEYCSYNNLKTRKSGDKRYIELDMRVYENYTMKQVTKLCQSIEKDINDILNNSDVMIQVESNDNNNKLTCKFGNVHKNKLTIKILHKNKLKKEENKWLV